MEKLSDSEQAHDIGPSVSNHLKLLRLRLDTADNYLGRHQSSIITWIYCKLKWATTASIAPVCLGMYRYDCGQICDCKKKGNKMETSISKLVILTSGAIPKYIPTNTLLRYIHKSFNNSIKLQVIEITTY